MLFSCKTLSCIILIHTCYFTLVVLQTVSSMPFQSSKHDKNKEYYKLHATDIKESSIKEYSFVREHFISKSMQHNESAASVNEGNLLHKCVREHHSRNLDTSRATINSRVSKYRQLCPDKSKAESKQHVPCIGSEMYYKQKKTLVGMCVHFSRGIH